MYLPPNSFSMRLPTTTSGWPGGICWSTSSNTRSRLMKNPSTSVTDHDGAMTVLGRPTIAVTYRRNICVS